MGNIIFTQDSEGDIALYHAIMISAQEGSYRDHEIIDKLISRSDLGLKNNHGFNSLLLAAASKNRM